jgi:hypothetical protein
VTDATESAETVAQFNGAYAAIQPADNIFGLLLSKKVVRRTLIRRDFAV